MIRYYVIIGILIAFCLFYKWLWGYWRRQARFWQNHLEHWKRMYDETKYGVPYNMPENFNTEPDPFKINFEPQDWGEREDPDPLPPRKEPTNHA